MVRRIEIIFLLVVVMELCAFGGGRGDVFLPDGMVLAGVDGRIVSSDSNDVFYFEVVANEELIKEGIKTGTRFELLPSSALEKAVVSAKGRSNWHCRVWGRVTQYKGRNFVFAAYFVGLSGIDIDSEKGAKRSGAVEVNQADDALSLPEEIAKKLARRRIVRPEQMEKPLELKEDFILASRRAVLLDGKDGKSELAFDGLGRGIEKIRFNLLPCEVLERAQRKQASEAERLRFKISGIVTEYKGEKFLLLQQVTQLYGHGNFE